MKNYDDRYRAPTLCLVLSALVSASGFGAEPRATISDSVDRASASAAPFDVPALPFLTVMLARDPAVQTELGLTRKQLDLLTQAVESVDAPLWQLRDVPIKDCGAKLDGLLSQFRKQLSEIFSASQVERLDQIILRAQGSLAPLSADMIQRLDLSPAQVSQIRDVLNETSRAGNPAEKAHRERPAVDSSQLRVRLEGPESRKILTKLSPTQQTQLVAMFGKPFDLTRIRRIGGAAPELREVDEWINSQPLKLADLRGKVVVVHFWAFECINCVHNLPHYQAWREKFPERDLTIIGIQTPETPSERNVDLLLQNVEDRKITYPVALDGSAANWKAWANHVWPSVYLVDKRGQIRGWWYGELNWQGARGEELMRQKIEELLAEK